MSRKDNKKGETLENATRIREYYGVSFWFSHGFSSFAKRCLIDLGKQQKNGIFLVVLTPPLEQSGHRHFFLVLK